MPVPDPSQQAATASPDGDGSATAADAGAGAGRATDRATAAASFDPGRASPDGPLPPHTAGCMVCGPDAPAGYHLHPRREGDEVRADFTFSAAHQGAPALAHGGAVAAVCDDLLGHVLRLAGTPAVTRRLEVDYLRPVVLGEAHRLAARLDARQGRKLWISGEGMGADGEVRFRASGLFVEVGIEHFLAGLGPQERARAQAGLDRSRGEEGGVAAW